MSRLNIYIQGEDSYGIYPSLDYAKNSKEDDYSLFFMDVKYPNMPVSSRTMTFDFPQEITSAWINIICDFAKKINAHSVNIHSAIHYSEKINFPLIKKFQEQVNAGLILSLFLYETRLSDVICRQEYDGLLQSGLAWQQYSQIFKQNIISENKEWNVVYNYLFNDIVNTHYYLSDFYENMHDVFWDSSNYQYLKDAYCNSEGEFVNDVVSMLGVDINIIDTIRDICGNNKTLFFIDDGIDHPLGTKSKDTCLLQEVLRDKFEFVFLMNYKGSMTNGVYCGINVICLPENITLDVLLLAGISLNHIYGFCSLGLFAGTKKNINKIFFHENEKYSENVQLSHCIRSSHYDDTLFVFINETQKRVDNSYIPKQIFLLAESMGDVLFAAGGLNALRGKLSGPIVCIVPQIYHTLLSLCPWVDELWDPKMVTKEQAEDLYIAQQLGNFHLPSHVKHILDKNHQIDSFVESLGYKDISNNHKEIVLSLEYVDKKNVDNFLQQNNLVDRIVLIHANVGVPNRTWPQQSWAELVEKLIMDGWSVVLIGSNNNFYSHKKAVGIDNSRVFDAIDKFTMGETVYLMTKASLLVACDSGPVALAAATKIAICALYSVVPGKNRLPYRQGVHGWNALAVDRPCKYHHCANTYSLESGEAFDEWCPNNKTYSCLKDYHPDDFYQEINKFLNSERYIDQCEQKYHGIRYVNV